MTFSLCRLLVIKPSGDAEETPDEEETSETTPHD